MIIKLRALWNDLVAELKGTRVLGRPEFEQNFPLGTL